MRRSCLLAVLVLLVSPPAFSDAGLRPFHDLPQDLGRRQPGADIGSGWLDRVRAAPTRLSNCTASFVSPDGLILTNHHCAAECLAQQSTPGHDRLRDGYAAPNRTA